MLVDKIYMSQEALNSDDEYSVILQNINNVNEYLGTLAKEEEILDDCLYSYYVDYYLAQVNNGGISQFIYNTNWNEKVVNYVKNGLQEMKATQNLKLFNGIIEIINTSLTKELLDTLLQEDYWWDAEINPFKDLLDKLDDNFFALKKTEDLIKINSQWLKNNPKLQLVTEAEFKDILVDVKNRIPNLQERLQELANKQPRYVKLIVKLCQQAEHKLERITAGDPSHKYNGQQVLAWHFLTNKGHLYMLDFEEYAVMFDDNNNEVYRIDGNIE